ncbi:TetR/AcrR family transcriptional regulator [Yinghuangia aomiensis]
MRKVASRKLGVEAMSLYHHVAEQGRDPRQGSSTSCSRPSNCPTRTTATGGRPSAPGRSLARGVLSRHSWALGLADSRRNRRARPRSATTTRGPRRPSAGRLHPADGRARRLADPRAATSADTFSKRRACPVTDPGDVEAVAGDILDALPADEFPYLAEMITDHALRPGYDHTAEFGYGRT